MEEVSRGKLVKLRSVKRRLNPEEGMAAGRGYRLRAITEGSVV